MENAPVGYYTRLLCEMRSLADGITGTMRSEAVNLKKRGTILHSMTSINSS